MTALACATAATAAAYTLAYKDGFPKSFPECILEYCLVKRSHMNPLLRTFNCVKGKLHDRGRVLCKSLGRGVLLGH